MKFVLHPWQLLLLILAGWINHQEQDVIEYLRADRCEGCPVTNAITELESESRTIHAIYQRRMPGMHNLLRGEITTECCVFLSDSLSSEEKPSRT